MGKVRVYELAKELGINSKKLIEVLHELNVDVKNHMSTMDQETANRVLEMLTKGQKKPLQAEEAAPEGEAAPAGEQAKEKAPEKEKRPAAKERPKKEEKRAKPEREGRKAKKAARRAEGKETAPAKETIVLEGYVTVGELANRLNLQPSEILGKLLELGIISNINQPLDSDILDILSEEYDINIEFKADPDEAELLSKVEAEVDKDEELKKRPPVVTILGHVDHGKTSLLDAIREANVMATEAGGITQHIGAYVAEYAGKKVVFLDTPGHEAFTAMRARGAQVTDIAILTVAADDGVMPQTVEAINHVKAAGVSIIVAVNKIDKPNADAEKVKRQLAEVGLIPEEWGGDTVLVYVSALKRQGLDELMEMILLVAEMSELTANYTRPARGSVIEAELDRGRGPVATMLIKDGTIRVGDPIICGSISGKVRAMIDDKGNRVEEATPSTPVEILGLTDVPQAGDNFMVVREERVARQIASKREEKVREASKRKTQKMSLDDLFKQIQEEEVELKLIIKADVQGSAEALDESLRKVENEQVKINIIHKGVGAITESDIMLASASNAIIIGFNIRPEANARKLAEKEKVDIRLYRVIYEAIEDVEAAIHGMLEPEYQEVVIGQVEVRQTFKISRVGTVAGCYVTDGKITRNSTIRVVRDGTVVHEGKIDTLKRFKDDVKEVSSGYECGILLENFNDIKEGDIFEAYVMEQVQAS